MMKKVSTGNSFFIINLENIETFNNFGGLTVHVMCSGIQFRNAIIARNISVLEKSFYLEGYGFFGGGFMIGASHNSLPLSATVTNVNISDNKVYDSWGGLDHFNTFSISGGVNNITNATIAFNEKENDLPGAYSTWENMTSCVYNSIFYGNEHPSIVLGV